MMFFIGMVSSPVLAQSYDQLWKEVETYQKKDLPKSVMATAGKIYKKAKKERNLPQMMKAQLVRSSSQVSLTPDSAEAEFKALKAWADGDDDTGTEGIYDGRGDPLFSSFGGKQGYIGAHFGKNVPSHDRIGQAERNVFQ